jgi:hypothetical protein
MARNNRIYRASPKVVVTIDNIEHRLAETAFLELMQEALPLVQRLVVERDARRAELQAQHRAADPHCTCNDCVAHHQTQLTPITRRRKHR